MGFNDTYVATNTDGFSVLTDDEQTTLKKEAYEHWIGFLFLKHADTRCYGSSINDLQAYFACNRDEYPQNMEKAINMLDSCKLDSNIKSNTHGTGKSSSSSSSRP